MSRQVWRDQIAETALEPDLPIIDAHHHVWESGAFPPFDSFNHDDLFAELTGSGHNIIATVCNDSHTSYRENGPEALRVVGETKYVERIALEGIRRGGRLAGTCAAIAPRANLLLGEAVADVLDAHAAASPRFRGIRHMTAYDPDVPATATTGPSVMMRPDFRAGFAELARRELSFDAWLLQPQLPEVIHLAKNFPGVTIVLDHLGGPLRIGRFAATPVESVVTWKRDMALLAIYPNVFVKLSGLNMGMAGVDAATSNRPFTSKKMADLQRSYILTAIDLFGVGRCMFASNVPIDTHNASYTSIWNAFKRVTTEFSVSERQMLFKDSAIRAYRIKIREETGQDLVRTA